MSTSNLRPSQIKCVPGWKADARARRILKEDRALSRMPKKDGQLTEREERFITHYLNVHSVVKASELAGLSGSAHGYMILKRPHIRREMQRRQTDMLHNELVPLSLQHLKRVLAPNSTAADRDKNQAANIVLKEAASQKILDATNDKPVAEMTKAELDEKLQNLLLELSNRAAPVTPMIEIEAISGDGPDVFG
jgi:phage terminase small subunit